MTQCFLTRTRPRYPATKHNDESVHRAPCLTQVHHDSTKQLHFLLIYSWYLVINSGPIASFMYLDASRNPPTLGGIVPY